MVKVEKWISWTSTIGCLWLWCFD